MKYDDASWHYGGEFPSESPQELGGTHIGIFLRWCFMKGWAGELHATEEKDDVEAVIRGEMSGTDFLFKYCDGKFTNEDLTDDGNAFASSYYDSSYLGDYTGLFADEMYVAPESAHDVSKIFKLLDQRLGGRPWWKFW